MLSPIRYLISRAYDRMACMTYVFKTPNFSTSQHILFRFITFSVSFQAALVTGKFNLALSLIRKVQNNTDLSIKLDNGQNLAHVLARQANENTLAVRPHIDLKFPRRYISLIQINCILKQLQVENFVIWFNCRLGGAVVAGQGRPVWFRRWVRLHSSALRLSTRKQAARPVHYW